MSSSFFLPPKLNRLLRFLPGGDSGMPGGGESERLLRGAGLEAAVCSRSGEVPRKDPPLGLAGTGSEGLGLSAASGAGGGAAGWLVGARRWMSGW